MRKCLISQSLSPRHCLGLNFPAPPLAGGRQGQPVALSPKMLVPTLCLLMGNLALSSVVPRQGQFIPKSLCVQAMARGEKAAFVSFSLAGKPSQAHSAAQHLASKSLIWASELQTQIEPL